MLALILSSLMLSHPSFAAPTVTSTTGRLYKISATGEELTFLGDGLMTRGNLGQIKMSAADNGYFRLVYQSIQPDGQRSKVWLGDQGLTCVVNFTRLSGSNHILIETLNDNASPYCKFGEIERIGNVRENFSSSSTSMIREGNRSVMYVNGKKVVDEICNGTAIMANGKYTCKPNDDSVLPAATNQPFPSAGEDAPGAMF